MNELEEVAELLEVKNRIFSRDKVAESQAEYAIKDNFDERFAKRMSGEELMKRVHKRPKLFWI